MSTFAKTSFLPVFTFAKTSFLLVFTLDETSFLPVSTFAKTSFILCLLLPRHHFFMSPLLSRHLSFYVRFCQHIISCDVHLSSRYFFLCPFLPRYHKLKTSCIWGMIQPIFITLAHAGYPRIAYNTIHFVSSIFHVRSFKPR